MVTDFFGTALRALPAAALGFALALAGCGGGGAVTQTVPDGGPAAPPPANGPAADA